MDGSQPPDRAPSSPPQGDGLRPIRPPQIPDYELLKRIGSGSYGDVWLARNVLGQHRAVKIIYRSRFSDPRPFEREFEGIQRFEPISRSHPSQLHILHVGKNDAQGCFYCVMELADPVGADVRRLPPTTPTKAEPPHLGSYNAGGINEGTTSPHVDAYSPHTLRHDLEHHGRLPIPDCVQIGISLTTALQHLHEAGLVHRDIKPSNVIFVNGSAKLGDIGLVTEAGDTQSIVGTEGYLPPEGPGTAQADLFSLGKVLYEISTGMDRRRFPELPEDLRSWPDRDAVVEFNEIVLKACDKDLGKRYRKADDLRADFALLQRGKSVRRSLARGRRAALVRKMAWAAAALALLFAILLPRVSRNAPDSLVDGPPSTNELANALCTKALMNLRFDNFAGFGEVYTNLHRAIELDPNFARPYIGLFELRTVEVRPPGVVYDTNETLQTITKKLSELAPDLAPTYFAQSCLSFWDLDFPKARELAEKSIQKAPKYPFSHAGYGFMLTHWGLPKEGRREVEIALELLPSKATIHRFLAHTYYVQRDFSHAVAAYRQTIQWEPHHAPAFQYMGNAYRAMTNYAKALEFHERADELYQSDLGAVARRYARLRQALDQKGPRGYWEEEWRQMADDPTIDFYWKAKVRFRLGDTNGAFELLNRSFDSWEYDGCMRPLMYLVFDEVWDPLHQDPRFKEILGKVGFTKVNPGLRP